MEKRGHRNERVFRKAGVMAKLTRKDIEADPFRYLGDLDSKAYQEAKNTNCEHGYTLVDSCPMCDREREQDK